MINRKHVAWMFLKGLLTLAVAGSPNLSAQDDGDSNEVYELSPFSVDAGDNTGYRANSTLAGTRLRSELKDIGSSIQVVTSEFLEDTGATNASELLIYTTNTETGGVGGNFSGVNVAPGRTDTQGPRASPQSAQRIRGLFTADLTRDYFLTEIPFDSYNTSRVEINRGSNAILFGLGSPAGIINNGLVDANFKDGGSVKFRVGEKGSFRTSFDINRELVEDKLAVRFAAVYDDRKYRQEPAFEEVKRYYGAVKYKPLENTTLRMHFEDGSISANRPDVVGPRENISGWLAVGKPLFDASRGTHDPTGIFVDLDGDGTLEEAPASMIDSGNVRVTTVGIDGVPFNAGNFFVTDGGLVDGPNFPIPAGADKNPLLTSARFWHQNGAIWDDYTSAAPSSGIFGQYPTRFRTAGDALDADGQVDNHRWVSARNLDSIFNNFARQGFTGIDQYDFSKSLLVGSASFQNEDFDNLNAVLEQTFFENNLGFEFAFDRQSYANESFAPFQDNAGNVYVDMNVVNLDGTPNKNVGRPFVDARRSKNDWTLERETFRATAYYDLDLKEMMNDRWGDILGRHVVTGFYNTREDERMSTSSRMAVNDTQILRALNTPGDITSFAAMLNPLMYVGDSLLDITSMENLPMRRLEGAQIWQPGQTFPYTFWDPGIQPGTQNSPATDAATILSQGQLVTKDVLMSEAFTGANLEERFVDSYAGILQSYWLKDHLVTTVGWRKDKVELQRISSAPRGDLRSMVPSRIRENDPSVVSLTDDRWSGGVVAHWPTGIVPLPGESRLSFHYSESSNFQPQAGRVDFRNRPIASPTGETEERGFTFATKNNKFVARVNWFDTILANRSSSTQLFGQIVTNAIWQTADFSFQGAQLVSDPDLAEFQIAAGNALLNGVLPGENDRQRPEITRDADGTPLRVTSSGGTGASDTEDVAASGMEIELTFNPRPNWRISANIAQQETVRSNVLPVARNELIPARLDLYENTPIPGFEWVTIGEASRGSLTDDNVIFDKENQILEYVNPNHLTNRQWLEQGQGQDNLIGFRTALAAEGAIATEQREWRFNLVTHYDFREGKLDGLGIGGAVRWQDSASIGFPFVENADGNKVGDVNNPYRDNAQENFDVWTRFKMPFFQDRFDWVMQLNVRNIFTSSNKVIPIQAQPDGSWARVRIAPQRTWFLSSEFTF